MWIGIVIGLGLGMTITTLMYGAMLLGASKRGVQNSKTVEALLIRKAEASERIADALESKGGQNG